LPSGEEKSFKSIIAINQLTYTDYKNRVVADMASGYDVLYSTIYENILDAGDQAEVMSCMNYFKTDST
jgi:hypothetical protein